MSEHVLFRRPSRRLATLAAAAVAALMLVAPQSASAAGATTVTGVVRASDTGQPLADVTVYLSDGETFADVAYTESDGSYVIPDVPEGAYDIFFGPFSERYVDEYFDSSPSYRTSTPVILTGGSRVIDATVERAAEFVTAASDTSRYSGTTGATTYRYNSELGDWVAVQSALDFNTGATSRFTRLSPGTYKVGFDNYSTASSPVGPEFFGDKKTPDASADVNLAIGTNNLSGTVTFDPFVFPTAQRVQGGTRYDVAVNVSKATYSGTAPVVYVATGSNYPDALSAGPLAAKQGGPLLLTTPDSLPSSVAAEITRLQPSRIVVVGGVNSVRPSVLTQLQNLQVARGQAATTVTRISGADRYEAGRNLVKSVFTGQVPLLYIATGQNFPDALSAGAAAGHYGVPVLLVNGQSPSLDAATLSLIAQLDPKEIRIAGGPNSVSPEIGAQLLRFAPTSRLFGEDRFEASQVISSDAFVTASRVFIATGFNFPDALAGSAWAGKAEAPLFTVPGNCVPDATKRAIAKLGPQSITILGGPNSVTTTVENLTVCG